MRNTANNVVKIENAEEGMEKVIVLTKPLEFEGERYEKIVLNFEDLTGEDIEKAEMQFNAESPQNSIVMVKEMSKGFTALVAAKAAGVHPSVIRKLSAPDYSKVTMRTTLFLMNGK